LLVPHLFVSFCLDHTSKSYSVFRQSTSVSKAWKAGSFTANAYSVFLKQNWLNVYSVVDDLLMTKSDRSLKKESTAKCKEISPREYFPRFTMGHCVLFVLLVVGAVLLLQTRSSTIFDKSNFVGTPSMGRLPSIAAIVKPSILVADGKGKVAVQVKQKKFRSTILNATMRSLKGVFRVTFGKAFSSGVRIKKRLFPSKAERTARALKRKNDAENRNIEEDTRPINTHLECIINDIMLTPVQCSLVEKAYADLLSLGGSNLTSDASCSNWTITPHLVFRYFASIDWLTKYNDRRYNLYCFEYSFVNKCFIN
jgi:hypothetical protein